MEDAWIGKATEKLFIAPIKLTLQPEITDLHMPYVGVAHNLVLVRINKNYPGQGMKVINSLFGAGQMMFSKLIVVVSGNIDIRDYEAVARQVFSNTDVNTDIIITRGPLDVLDHSSDNFSFGGKMGIDATEKMSEESVRDVMSGFRTTILLSVFKPLKGKVRFKMPFTDLPVVFTGISKDVITFNELLKLNYKITGLVLIVVDHTVDLDDNLILFWQVLSNTDPYRDLKIVDGNILIDSTSKAHSSDNFSRKWPNIVVSDKKTINKIDSIMAGLGSGELIPSPSGRLVNMDYGGGASVQVD